MKKPPNRDAIRKVVTFDPLTGAFHWRPGHPHEGQRADFVSHKGYSYLNVCGRRLSAHRAVWIYIFDRLPPVNLDHINGVRSDNRLENLRECDREENGRNRRATRAGTRSGFKGVQIATKKNLANPYRAFIYTKGKAIHLGYFSSGDEAAHAYNKAAVELFGDFACLNPIGVDKDPTTSQQNKGDA